MAIANATVSKIFDDLDAYRDFCRFEGEGRVFDEKALYNKKDANWQAYEKHQNYLKARGRVKNRKY
jgi:hypothetical protein